MTFSRITAVLVSVFLVGPFLWMVFDRYPPYVRLDGIITPESPAPGDFVSVNWTIKVHRNCTPTPRRNITRRVVDATGKHHDYEPIEGVYGLSPDPSGGALSRSFQLPAFIASGPAIYKSSATFACNPLHTFWPIVVDTPDIKFTIAQPRS